MARPRRGEQKNATEGFAFRVHPDLRKQVMEYAEKRNWSITKTLTVALQRLVKAGRSVER